VLVDRRVRATPGEASGRCNRHRFPSDKKMFGKLMPRAARSVATVSPRPCARFGTMERVYRVEERTRSCLPRPAPRGADPAVGPSTSTEYIQNTWVTRRASTGNGEVPLRVAGARDTMRDLPRSEEASRVFHLAQTYGLPGGWSMRKF